MEEKLNFEWNLWELNSRELYVAPSKCDGKILEAPKGAYQYIYKQGLEVL